jgi:hypothetical protein
MIEGDSGDGYDTAQADDGYDAAQTDCDNWTKLKTQYGVQWPRVNNEYHYQPWARSAGHAHSILNTAVKRAKELATEQPRIVNTQRLARACKRPVDYSYGQLSADPEAVTTWRNDTTQESPDMELIRNKKLRGHQHCTIRTSTKTNASLGLMVTKPMIATQVICGYEGPEVMWNASDGDVFEGSDYTTRLITPDRSICINGHQRASSLGRYANDPIDERRVNAKIVWRKGIAVLVATEPIAAGSEVFISYPKDFWKSRLHILCPEDRDLMVRKMHSVHFASDLTVHRFLNHKAATHKVTKGEERYLLEDDSWHLSAELSTRVAKEGLMEARIQRRFRDEEEADNEAYDNMPQDEELAAKLQYLVGMKYHEPAADNNLYEVGLIQYDPIHKVVSGSRKSLTSKTHPEDNHMFTVYGPEGLLMLTSQYLAAYGKGDIQWPSTLSLMADAQLNCPFLAPMLEQIQRTELKAMDLKLPHWTEPIKLRLSPTEDKDKFILVRELAQTATNKISWPVMLPKSLIQRCMHTYHEGWAHGGSQRTLDTIKLYYFWPTMRADVLMHVDECIPCKLRKSYGRRPKVPVASYPPANYPLSRVHMDLTGPLPTTDGNKHKYILVVKDYLTKFVWLFPLKDKTAKAVVEPLVTELFCAWGFPDQLVSDRGTEFMNELMTKVTHMLRVNRISSTSYNPRAQGLVEGHNKTLKDQLYHFTNVVQTDWNIFLPTVQLMYNTTVSRSTGLTPYFLMFGRECRMPSSLSLDEPLDKTKKSSTRLDLRWIDQLVQSLQVAWELMTTLAIEKSFRFNLPITQPAVFKPYQPGDRFFRAKRAVYEFKSADEKEKYHITAKLMARYEGPYTVIRQVSPILYDVDIDGKQVRMNAVNMKPF